MAVKPSSVDTVSGIITWGRSSATTKELHDLLPVRQSFSRVFLLLDERRNKRAEQERRGFKEIDDLMAAKASRDRQIVIYPRMTEETDISKLERKELRVIAVEEKKELARKKREFRPTGNLMTGRVKWT